MIFTLISAQLIYAEISIYFGLLIREKAAAKFLLRFTQSANINCHPIVLT